MEEIDAVVLPFKIVPKAEPEVVEPEVTPIDNVLEGIEKVKHKLDHLIVIGSSNDGHFYFATTSGDSRQIVYDLESAKNIAMEYGMQSRQEVDYDDR